MKSCKSVSLVLYGIHCQFSLSELSEDQYTRWTNEGLPKSDTEEYFDYLYLCENRVNCGLLVDGPLTLCVDEVEVKNLQRKIFFVGNTAIKSWGQRFECGKFYLANVETYSAAYAIELENTFKFSNLRWTVTQVDLDGCHSADLLTASYNDEDLDLLFPDDKDGLEIKDWLIAKK